MAAIIVGVVVVGGIGAYVLFHKNHPAPAQVPQIAVQTAPAPVKTPSAVSPVQPKTAASHAVVAAASSSPAPVLSLGASASAPKAASSAAAQPQVKAPSLAASATSAPTAAKAASGATPAATRPAAMASAAAASVQNPAAKAALVDNGAQQAQQDAKMQAMQSQIAALQTKLAEEHADKGAKTQVGAQASVKTARHAAHRFAPSIKHWTLLGVVDQTAVVRLPNGSVHNVHAGQWLDGVRIRAIDASSVQTTRGELGLQ